MADDTLVYTASLRYDIDAAASQAEAERTVKQYATQLPDTMIVVGDPTLIWHEQHGDSGEYFFEVDVEIHVDDQLAHDHVDVDVDASAEDDLFDRVRNAGQRLAEDRAADLPAGWSLHRRIEYSRYAC